MKANNLKTVIFRQLAMRVSAFLFRNDTFRSAGAMGFSVTIHIIMFALYFGLADMNVAETPPIREITFIDMTEELPAETPEIQPKPVKKIVQAAAVLPETNELPQPETGASIAAAGSDKIFLDRKRKQAPINIEKVQAVANNIVKPADLIKISPAKGIRDDEKIARPTPISLGDSQNLLASTAPVTAGIAVDGPKTPQIQLGAGTGKSNATNSGSIKIDSKPKQKDLNPDALKPDQPGTVITGALANRKIIRKIIPPFPEWAKRQGVSATVALRFTVMENGVVRENVVVVRTSGSGEWDRLVIEALKQWQFAALENSGIRLDQSGVITFQFVI